MNNSYLYTVLMLFIAIILGIIIHTFNPEISVLEFYIAAIVGYIALEQARSK